MLRKSYKITMFTMLKDNLINNDDKKTVKKFSRWSNL